MKAIKRFLRKLGILKPLPVKVNGNKYAHIPAGDIVHKEILTLSRSKGYRELQGYLIVSELVADGGISDVQDKDLRILLTTVQKELGALIRTINSRMENLHVREIFNDYPFIIESMIKHKDKS